MFLSVILLTSCAESRNLEELGLQTIIGFDIKEDGSILGTSVLHHFKQIGESPVQILTATAKTSKGFRQEMNLKTSKKLVSGQIRVALYGEETAKKGIISLLDSLSRDPKIGTMLYIVVTKGKANEILTYPYKDIKNVGVYIKQTVEQNIRGEQAVSSTLHEVLNDYYSEGKDPLVVYISREKDLIKIEGMALFQGDEMVGTIVSREAFYLKLIKDRFEAGEIELILPAIELKKYRKGDKEAKHVNVEIDNIRSSSDIKLINNKDKPEFDVKIKTTARIQEISLQLELGEPEAIQIMSKLINEALTKEANQLIEKLQKIPTDPVGFGQIYNHSIRNKEKLSTENWYPLYKNAKINVHIETTLLNTGVKD